MSDIRRFLFIVVALAVLATSQNVWRNTAQAQTPATQSAAAVSSPESSQVKIKTSEVLLDVVVYDKKGKPIYDLKPEEIEIYEDGAKQTVSSFKIIGNPTAAPANAPSAQSSATENVSLPSGESVPAKPLNLVTMLFDHLASNRVMPVRDAALNFLDNSLTPDMQVRVMVVGQRLYLIEQFTNDRAKLKKAVERAVSTVEKSFVERSHQLAEELKQSLAAPAENKEANQTVALAKLSLDTLDFADKLSREVRSNHHIFSLIPFARAHRNMPGRKMALYFSDGLYMPNSLSEVTRAAIGEANRSNLSFYAINTRNLVVGAGNQSSRLESSTVINATRRAESAGFNNALADSFNTSDRVAGRGQITTNFNMFEVIDRNKELNKQGPLSELTEGTGGFQITNVNDLNGALKRVGVELGHYYALSYTPTKQEYDGKFRNLSVKVLRNGAKAQTRSGYFAIPPTSNTRPVLSYETPLLAALNSATVPHDFKFEMGTWHFETRDALTVHYVLMLEVPFAHLLHTVDAKKKAYPVGFSVLALVKDEKGEIVQRFSEPYELEVPETLLETVKRTNYNLTRHFQLAPGEYTLEAAIHDQKSEQISAQRMRFKVVASSGKLQTSSLLLVKQIEPVEAANADPDNPLITGTQRLVPELGANFSNKERAELSFHLGIFNAAAPAKPTLQLELLQDNKVLATSHPELPAPDEKSHISYIAGLDTSNFFSGTYQFRATVKQGENVAVESASFTITSDRKHENDPEEKTIASTLTVKDKTSELALVSLKDAKPLDISINELLQEVEQTGEKMYHRIGEYTYSLRKVRRVLTAKGQIRSEDYQDYEAYPVKGRHALIRLSENGTTLNIKRLDLERKAATNVLIKSEEELQKLKGNEESDLDKKIGYWGASVEGIVQKRGQPRRLAYITVDPEIFFRSCTFSAPHTVLFEGRETIVLDFKPRANAKLDGDKDWVTKLEGKLWIDAVDKALVRIEGQSPTSPNATLLAEQPLNFVYQQQRLPAGTWVPSLIRINAAGNEELFRGLNWDAWFEVSNFKRFDSRDLEIKITSPEEKK